MKKRLLSLFTAAIMLVGIGNSFVFTRTAKAAPDSITDGAVATLNNFEPLTDGYTFISDEHTSGMTSVPLNTWLDEPKVRTSGKNDFGVATNRGTSTINGQTYYNSLLLKGNQRSVAFVVAAESEVTVYGNANSSRIFAAGTTVGGYDIAVGTAGNATFTFTAPTDKVIYVSGIDAETMAGSDMYLAGFTVKSEKQTETRTVAEWDFENNDTVFNNINTGEGAKLEIENGTDTNTSKVLSLFSGNASTGLTKVMRAQLDFSEYIPERASKVCVEFDAADCTAMGSTRINYLLFDKSIRTDLTSGGDIDTGILFQIGNVGTNVFAINKNKQNAAPTASWVHIKVEINLENNKYSYAVTYPDNSIYASGENTVFHDTDSSTPTGLEIINWVGNTTAYIDNIKVNVTAPKDAFDDEPTLTPTPKPHPTPDCDKTQKISYNYSYDKTNGYSNSDKHERVMEKLGRGLVAMEMDKGAYLSWRLLDNEDALYGSSEENISFNIYRNGTKIGTVKNSTNYIDLDANLDDKNLSYSVAPIRNGSEDELCESVKVMENSYYDIPLDKPAAAVLKDGTTKEYEATEASAGDLDGDGEYELVIKWNAGITSAGMSDTEYKGPVLLEAYKLDGTKLWKQPINLGINVFADQHNTQFLVYDFDGDGYAEITCQTSSGSKDANGNYVNLVSADSSVRAIDNSVDHMDKNGRVLEAEELFTVFNGADGSAIDTIYYPIALADSTTFGDDKGNRSTRFLADVSYLDGEIPYAVYWRGYYTAHGDSTVGRTGVFGASFNGERLDVKYIFDTYDIENSVYASTYTGIPAYTLGNEKYIGQGNHNITTADVDGDGKDEVISGALCFEVDNEDKLMPKWCSQRGHGDYLHIGDYDPTNKGLEYFSVHEGGGYTVSMPDGSEKNIDYGMTVYDAATGDELIHISNTDDTASGVMANTGQGEGYYIISGATSCGTYICKGGDKYEEADVGTGTPVFRVFWDGDLYDELSSSGVVVKKWKETAYEDIFSGPAMGTRERFSLIQADLFGDWREELIIPTVDSTKLRVFMTPYATNYKMKTLMQDPVYRSGVAAFQTATTVSPHVGFYIGKELFGEEEAQLKITSLPEKTIYAKGTALDTSGLKVEAVYENNNSKPINDYTVSGYNPDISGEQTVTVSYMGQTDTFSVTVKELSEIYVSRMPYSLLNYIGAPINTDGLEIKAKYSDGSEEALLNSEYTLSYSFTNAGEQKVTVKYKDKSTSFNVTVKEAEIGALNRTYYTDSNESVENVIPIGEYTGEFTIEHTVKINSVPADCGDGKNDTDGFFARFMNYDSRGNIKQVGGGWYLKNIGDAVLLCWKGTGSTGYTTVCSLKTNKSYNFKYELVNIGTGSATVESSAEDCASVTLTVADMEGNVIGTAAALPLRGFSGTTGNTLPINSLQVYNRAKTGENASITVSNAISYIGSAPTEYTVSFVNYDGVILQNSNVTVGDTPKYIGETPIKPSDNMYSYTFAGWSPEITPVTGITVYTAQFTKKSQEYIVTLNTNGGTINSGNITKYTFGTGATLPTDVTRSGYIFGGWYDNSDCTGTAITAISAADTGDKTYYAKWIEETDPTKCVRIIAEYKADGSLDKIVSIDEINISEIEEAANTPTRKTFYWDSLSGMKTVRKSDTN